MTECFLQASLLWQIYITAIHHETPENSMHSFPCQATLPESEVPLASLHFGLCHVWNVGLGRPASG